MIADEHLPLGDPRTDSQTVREILAPLDSILDSMKQGLKGIPFYRSFCAGQVTAPHLAMIFGQFYPYIAQTPRTLHTMAETTRRQYAKHPDAFYRNLWEHFQRHEESETGHENLLLNDLAALGIHSPPEVLVGEAWEPVREYIRGAQQTAETHPLGNVGEAWLLEGITPDVEGQWQHIVKNSGIPKVEKALSFMQTESAADVAHLKSRRKLILDLERTQEAEDHWRQIEARSGQVKAFYLSLWQEFDRRAA